MLARTVPTGIATRSVHSDVVGSDDIVRDVVAISHEIGCSSAQVAISWVRQQPGSVIPLIAARTEEQFRDNLAAIDVHLSQQHLDRLGVLSRPTLGFPMDVMREASVVGGVYGAQLPSIDAPASRPCAAPLPPRDGSFCVLIRCIGVVIGFWRKWCD